MTKKQKVTIDVTPEELQWLRNVLCYGSEVTNLLKRDLPEFRDDKWKKIQFDLFRRRPFGVD